MGADVVDLRIPEEKSHKIIYVVSVFFGLFFWFLAFIPYYILETIAPVPPPIPGAMYESSLFDLILGGLSAYGIFVTGLLLQLKLEVVRTEGHIRNSSKGVVILTQLPIILFTFLFLNMLAFKYQFEILMLLLYLGGSLFTVRLVTKKKMDKSFDFWIIILGIIFVFAPASIVHSLRFH